MKKVYWILPVVLVFSYAAGFSQEEPIKDIRSVLTRQEFVRAGLGKLTEAELTQLSGSLFGWRSAEKNKALKSSEKVTMEQESGFGKDPIFEPETIEKPESPKSIQSKILGTFTGWDGSTRFVLENGQEWKQIDKKNFYVRLTDPKVEIKKGLFGTYFLSLVGYGSKCKVERVE
jgi:hypothetical protein